MKNEYGFIVYYLHENIFFNTYSYFYILKHYILPNQKL